MTDFIPLDINAGIDGAIGEPGGPATSKAAESPLTKLLSELRRRHASAAGPQVGVVMGFGVLPYASDVDVEDMARRMLTNEADEGDWASGGDVRRSALGLLPGNGSGGGGGAGSASACGRTRTHQHSPKVRTERRRLSSFAFKKTHLPHVREGSEDDPLAAVAGASSSPMSDSKKSRRLSGLGGSAHGSSQLVGVQALHRAAAKQSYKLSSSHADNLLQSTPHLRHLSQASVDMDGRGNFPTSRSFLSQLLPSSQPASAVSIGSIGTDAAPGSSKKSKGGLKPMADYGTCRARSRANRQAALELAAFVRVLGHEMSLEQFALVEADMLKSIFALVHSADNINRLAGVVALDALIDVPSADEEKKAIKFANNLSNGLRANNVDYEFLAAVSKALGRMATGAANVDYVECEITRALEWLRMERSDRRLAATLTLKELARNAPTAFFTKTTQSNIGHGGSNDFLDHIFPVLRDPQPIVRVCAADALGACLRVIMERKPSSTTGLLIQVYTGMMDGFDAPKRSSKRANNNTNIVGNLKLEAGQHASLLVLREMLDHCCNFVLPRLEDVCDAVLELAEHQKALIRLEAIRLIPRLAQCAPGAFSRRYLRKSLDFLVASAINPPPQKVGVDLRPAAFFAIGQLALAMRDPEGEGIIRTTIQIRRKSDDPSEKEIIYDSEDGDIYSKLDDIFALVKSELHKSRQSAPSKPAGGISADTRCEALHCGADLVQAFGLHSQDYVPDLLECMFETGLSRDLILCLRAIASRLPSEKLAIEDRLLEEISVCLAGTPAIHEICDPFRQSRSKCSNYGSDDPSGDAPGVRPRSMSNWSTRSRRTSSLANVMDGHLSSPHLGLDVSNHRGAAFNTMRQSSARHSDPRINPEGEKDEDQDIRIWINTLTNRSIVEKLVLSLRTLGSFGKGRGQQATYGSCVTLLPFVRDVVASYLSHPSSDVRREASLTCCLLLLPKNDAGPSDDMSDQRLSYCNSLAGLQPTVSSNGLILQMRLGGASGALIEEVLQKLLTAVVSDLSPLVRNCIVRALDARYDPYLCQAHHLPPLFLLLHDESLAVRAAALRLLGRLSVLNPAPILPGLRRVLVELILELRCGGDTGGGRESATRLLVVFLQGEALKRLIQPFLPSIIEALPLKGVAPRLASASLEALGELAQVTRKSMTPWIQQLIPHILETMQDQSSSNKQRTSMKTLGQIASGTGYVISPYIDYPQLLPIAADILPATKRAPWALRREVIRTLGILGALDPDRYFAHKARKGGVAGGGYFIEGEDDLPIDTAAANVSSQSSSYDGVTTSDANLSGATSTAIVARKNPPDIVASPQLQPKMDMDAEIKGKDADEEEPAHLYMYEQYAMTSQPDSKLPPARRLTPSDEDFYPTVAVQALTRILKDPSLAVYHGMVMQSVMYIFNNLGLRCVPFLKRIVPHILHTVRTCGQESLRESLLQQVASLSGIVRDHLRPYLPAIFDVVEEFWNTTRHLATILSLVEKMADGVPDDFRRYVPRLVPQILASIETSQIQITEWRAGNRQYTSAVDQFDRLELILRSIRGALRGTLGDYLQLLVPALVKLTDALTDPATTIGANNYPGFTRLTITTIHTISVLLMTADTSSLSLTSVTSGRMPRTMVAVASSSSSLPARAAQPLTRMLSREPHVSKDVGFALIQAICVCAKRLGKERWMAFFDVAARNVITKWQERVGLGQNSDDPPRSGSEIHGGSGRPESMQDDGGRQEFAGLLLYEEVVREMTTPAYLVGNESIIDAGAGGQLVSSESQHVLAGDFGFDGPDLLDNDLAPTTPSLLPPISSAGPSTNKHRVNQTNLQRSWDVSSRSTREDWDEWMRRFAVQLLREAPSPALRATAGLAQAYQPLARELFAAAFVCCWADLSDQYQQHLVRSLETAFVADVSPEILQTLLNLAEFMEQCDGVDGDLPIDISILADLALKCRNYAKALHYKEREHNTRVDGGACIEDLISINRKLDLPEAALGAVKAAQVELERQGEQLWNNPNYDYGGSMHHHLPSRLFHHQAQDMAYSVMASAEEIAALGGGSWAGVQMQESWLAKLGSWSEALTMYEGKLEENPEDVGAILGCMRCLDARGEWRKVIDLAKKNWLALSCESGESQTRKHLRKATKFCAEAAWRLGQWDELETYASQLSTGAYDPSSSQNTTLNTDDSSLPRIDFDGSFYSAVLNIHKKEWSLAAGAIDGARRAMDSRFTALMAESYKRAYPSMVTAQTLSEMEEIVSFRKLEDRAKASEHQHPANRADAEESRDELLSVWRRRLAGCRVDADVHASILAVRSLVLGPTDEVAATLSLSALSRQAQSFKLAERLLVDPLHELGADLNGAAFGFGLPPSLELGLQPPRDDDHGYGSAIDRLVTGRSEDFLPHYESIHEEYTRKLVEEAGGLDRLNIQHRLYYAYTKHLWTMDHHAEALTRVANLCKVVDMIAHCDRGAQDRGLRVACWLKLGEWKVAESIQPGSSPMSESLQMEVLTAYKRATASSDCGYKAWHAWALINFRLAQQMHDSPGFRLQASYGSRALRSSSTSKILRHHVIAAVKGFVSAICLGTKRWSASVQQDLLNFLTCLFNFGELPEVAATINTVITSVKIEAWLGVLPQLLARIHIKSPSVRSVLHPLLIRLGTEHPQALMYPLSVLLKSPVIERKLAAESLMTSLKRHSNSLVEEALMVSSELIRVAILWLELWWEGLEDASRLYFGEGNVKGMLDVLIPLHEQLERGPMTRREDEFTRSFGRDLADAHAFVKEYIRLTTSNGGVIPSTGGFIPGSSDQAESPSPGLAVRQNAEAEAALNQAWDLYYTVFRRINKQLPALTSLELSQCSPALQNARNLELGVPGSYRVDKSYVRIEKFIPKVQVITSKQRPRKITLRGNDGKDYVFLLKGHEDLRQDERVMQLFGLVNALLARDRRTNQYDLNIKRYAIAPLSHNAGVVGWVPHCDTLHSLIRDYRESKKTPLNMENREMMKLAPNYDLLTVMQKVEVFTEALDRTTGKGNDLYEVLWTKSTNSEEWLERRTKFTRSLAVMSMVGYILGLGDRHPSNLMLDQVSGRVLHIDFGDCFEVAMHREKFPEKIPFRLTRMLIKAMEVCGVEGSYRSTCERTMGVLRDNRDSLVAMLEAFVYDPLISWRLLGQSSDGNDGDEQQQQQEQVIAPSGRVSDAPVLTQASGFAAVPVAPTAGSVQTIREGQEEEEEDEDNESNEADGGGDGRAENYPQTEADGSGNLPDQGVMATANAEGAANAAHARSLQMYNAMQSMAAAFSASARVASITGGDTIRAAAAEGSLARSRIDRSVRQREVLSLLDGDEGIATEEALNEKALKVIRRVQDKLAGTDFLGPDEIGEPLDVQDQVQRLIVQATSSENLCQLFIGWCAFW